MKKVFLLLTMLLFAFTGTMRAEGVEIGSLDGAANNSYLPMNSLYEYSFSEQIYTADEIGTAGTINAVTVWLYGNTNLYTMPFDIYMVEVDKDVFENTSDWVTVTEADVVYSGEITVHNTDAEPYTFELSSPFSYSGTGNLVIAFNNNTGQWKSGLNGKVFGASGDPVRSIYVRRDGTPYDITNLPAATSTTYQRNVIVLDVTAGGGGQPITVEIGDLDGAANNSYLPMNSLYEYSFSEQIYTADEIGANGTINAITMWLYGNTNLYTMPFDIYMVEVDKDVFENTSDWVTVTEADVVYSGEITVHNTDAEPYTFELSSPFSYSGTGNLVIAFNNNTGQWKSGLNGKVFGASGDPVRSIYVRRDGTPYDIANLPAATSTTYQRNVIVIDMTTGGGGQTCAKPRALAVNYEGGTTAELSWSSEADTWNIQLNDLIITGVTENPYVLEDLELGMTYDVAVQADCGFGTSDWSSPITFTTDFCLEEDMCEIRFDLTDSYGDGWNGNAIKVTDVESGVVLAQLANTSAAGAGETQTYYLPVCDGREIEFSWVSGSYPGEASYVVTDSRGIEIFAGSGKLANPVLFTVDCSELVPEIHVTPDPLFVGYRPNGAWMEPFKAQFNNVGLPTTVSLILVDNEYFTLDVEETPFNMAYQEDKDFTIATGDAEAGEVEGTIILSYRETREVGTIPVTAMAYDPEEGDVWETASEVEVPYTGTAPEIIYHNYNIPGATAEHVDAVYKVTLESSALLNVNIGEAANAKVAVYAEDFNGEPGPKANNTYTPGNTPEPTGEWYQYGTDELATGVGAGGSIFWGVMFPAGSYVGNQVVTAATYEVAGYPFEGYAYVCYGGDTAPETIAGEMPVSVDGDANGWAEFTFDSPVSIDPTENLWIIFQQVSGSNYPAGACTDAGDPNARWVSLDGETWMDLATAGLPGYSWMIKAYVGTGYRGEVAELGTLPIITATSSTLAMNPMPVNNNRANEGNASIEGLYVQPGTYYIVVAATEPIAEVNITTDPVPMPEPAVVINPLDGTANVPTSFTAQWEIGEYTDEMQVILGTQYPPETILLDWTNHIVNSYNVTDLEPNQSYFLQVNERNATGTTEGEIIAFTTVINPVQGFAVESANLYPGEAAAFSWEANRSFQGYNLYQDGVKVNEDVITENTYMVEGLEYNMTGYNFTITAVYDAGESVESDAILVKMTGNGTVNGHVYDTDEEHPIAFATIEFRGNDQYNLSQIITAQTDADGAYTCEVLAGHFTPYVVTEGYAEVPGATLNIAYEGVYDDVDIITHEFYYPLSMITATEEEENVLVEWAWTPAEMSIDFETGDFSQANFVLPASYPWAITTVNPHEGTYCMKSTCEGIASGTSSIEVNVDVPYDGKMGFWVRVSSEANYDKFHFYIDGVEKGAAISGQQAYAYKEFDVTEGTHVYKWEYAKDSSVNSNDDCAYVDDITLYRYEAPLPPVVGATTYDFDDSSMMGWTSIDADGDGNGWVSSANPGIYHNAGVSLSGTGNNASEAYVISGSYANQTGQALTPDNYLVSPAQISAESGAQIQFWACAQDASYAAEHFGVAVSTTTATAAAFTTIQEWTMTAKDNAAADVYSEVRGTRQGNWYQYSVDLSAYAGQDIWVAIRHFACTDMFILNVDDITLATGGTKVAPRSNRSLMSYNLYRRNNIENATPTLIAEGIDPETMDYTDEAWSTLPYGVYQWGIQATYDGYAPVDRSVMSTADRNADDSNDFAEGTVVVNNRDQWDLVYSFEGTSGYQYGVASDGNYIYTSSWSANSSSMFYKYDMEGNFIEEFNISGSGQCRGLTYDGQYFYGVANASTVYCLDLANHALVSTFTTSYGAMRCITYDSERDGFWVVGNWSGNLTLIDRTGAIVQAAGAPTSASDVAYWKDSDGVEHVLYLKNASGYGEVYEYNITTNTMVTTPLFDCSTYTSWTGSSGGCFVGTYDDKVCFFADAQQSPQLICIYELEAEEPGPVPPTPVPTGDGLSEILWSNEIEKDMVATLTFNVTLDNGQSPDGAVVTIESEAHSYTETVANGVAIVEVRKGETDTITVSKAGYSTWTPTGNPILVESDLTYDIMLIETIGPVEDLYVSPTGWAMWEGTAGGGVNPGPTPGPTPGEDEEFDFDDNTMMGWTSIDGDGDGNGWVSSANPGIYHNSGVNLSGTGHNSSEAYVISGSYANQTGQALTPNNFLVSPTKAQRAGITFYACAQDASYAAEHFGVAVSTTGNTSASDFTTIQEWTMTAKSEGAMSAGRTRQTRQGSWYEYNVDLSAYAGQEIWVAIRHFNCTDMFILNVDDITLSAGSKGSRAALSYKVMLDGQYVGETVNNGFQHNVEGLEIGSTHTTSVRPIFLNGQGDWMTYTWTLRDCADFAGVTGLAAEAQGADVKLTWTMPDAPGPGPGPGPQPGPEETFNFDDSTFQGWTTIDGGSPSGYGWQIGSTKLGSTGNGHNSSTDLVLSQSYDNNYGVVYPNNFLICPTKAQYTSVSLWACGQDSGYAAEHFGIAVSTTGNTSASDFVMVNEWTIGQKGQGQPTSVTRSGSRAQSTWIEYTADLSAYAGQEIWVAVRHFNCSDMFYLDVDDITLTTAATKGNDRAMWDLVYSFEGTSGYQYGVASDGENIYTSSWSASSTSMFYKYDLQGNFIEEFNISGCGQLRDMTYDGEYFYGVANASTVYCVDLANHSLVATFSTSYGAMRCITYDSERDGFWVVGNWSGNLTLIDRTGAIVQTAGEPSSASGIAYFKDSDGVEHIYYLKNATANGEVYEYNITNNTMGTSPVYNCVNTTGGAAAWTGSSGGCFVGTYDNKVCLFADAQQSPQLINIYELSADAPGPGPTPTPTEGILGSMVFADGEYLAFLEGSTSEYVVEAAAMEEMEYSVRVVYDGAPDTTYYAMSCPATVNYTPGTVVCDPVTNLTAEPYTYNGNDGALIQFTEPAGATSYKVYVEGQLLGSIAAQPIFINFEDTPDGDYEIGIVAVYANCESDMVTVMFTWDAIAEEEIVNAIYPNPTSGDLHINATAMTHVSVFNAMGQMVYDQEVSGDELILNMGQYETGVYMVRVTTETGSCVKRINVVK